MRRRDFLPGGRRRRASLGVRRSSGARGRRADRFKNRDARCAVRRLRQYGIQAKRAAELFSRTSRAKAFSAGPSSSSTRTRPGIPPRRAQGPEARGKGWREVPHGRRPVLGGPRRLRQVPRVEGHLHVDHQRGGRPYREGLAPLLLPGEHERPHGRARDQPLSGGRTHEALLRAGQRLRLGA